MSRLLGGVGYSIIKVRAVEPLGAEKNDYADWRLEEWKDGRLEDWRIEDDGGQQEAVRAMRDGLRHGWP